MRALLITASDCSETSRAHLARLLASLGHQSTPLELILVQRGGQAGELAPPVGVVLHTIERPSATSLSAARNCGLAYAKEHRLIERADTVAFPDDDCVYPPGLLNAVEDALAGGMDMVCGPYGPRRGEIDWERFPLGPRSLTPSFVTRVVSSNNVFFASRVVHALGEFDERFGLGARLGSSEDTDYALRALDAGFVGLYSPEDLFVSHPYKARRPGEYYVGNVAVLAKHVLGTRRMPLSLAHRLLVGAGLLVKRRLTARAYARAVRVAGALVFEAVRDAAEPRSRRRAGGCE